MAVKKIYIEADTNNFSSKKPYENQNQPVVTVSAKTLSDASKASAQSTNDKKNK